MDVHYYYMLVDYAVMCVCVCILYVCVCFYAVLAGRNINVCFCNCRPEVLKITYSRKKFFVELRPSLVSGKNRVTCIHTCMYMLYCFSI